MHFNAASSHLFSALVAPCLLVMVLSGGGPSIGAPFCRDPDRVLVTDAFVRQAAPLPEPAVRAPFRDPVFGSCLVRVTDRTADFAGDKELKGFRNENSRVQAFNADESVILIRGVKGSLNWFIYDATTLRPVRKLRSTELVNPRWDAADPHLLNFIDGTRLLAYDIRTDEQRLIHDFAIDFPGREVFVQGSPSLDGRYWGLIAEDADLLPVAFLVYDQAADRIVALRGMQNGPLIKDEDVTKRPYFDYVTVSPLGGYFVAAFNRVCDSGAPGSDPRPCGFMVYDRNLRNGRRLGLGGIVYHDLALDTRGREVIVYQDYHDFAMIDLETGETTALWPIIFGRSSISFNFSGRATGRPGWVLVSTYGDSAVADTWMDNQVFAIELKPKGRVVRFAHTRSLVSSKIGHDLWAAPQAATNREMNRALFTTNWGRSGTDQVETMLIDLPPDWPDQLR